MSSEPVFAAGAIRRPLIVRRIASARVMRLAVDPRDGGVRLTLPRRASEAQGRRWAEAQRTWIETELARLPCPRPFTDGGRIPFRGAEARIVWSASAPRQPGFDGEVILLGGAIESLPRRMLAWLRAEALATLAAETEAIAARAGVSIGRVTTGDPRGRWGSCSAKGDIRYSWRLILAPPEVLRSTVAHEVAHRLHMDHSPVFRAAEARLLGADPAPARAWLREHGAALYWVGRTG
ncbi:MAG TPA: SprT family zinc-dependent metalloprotease [Sphingomonas sp.]|nr:SprT family zinc-dependent metalloprotease [Sphingomonas sp.]